MKPLIQWIGAKEHKKDIQVMHRLILSLGNTKDKAAVDTLTKLLVDKDNAIIAAASEALGSFAGSDLETRKKCFEELLKNLMSAQGNKDASPQDMTAADKFNAVSAAMIASLQKLSKQTEVRKPDEFQKFWNKNKAKNWDAPQVDRRRKARKTARRHTARLRPGACRTTRERARPPRRSASLSVSPERLCVSCSVPAWAGCSSRWRGREAGGRRRAVHRPRRSRKRTSFAGELSRSRCREATARVRVTLTRLQARAERQAFDAQVLRRRFGLAPGEPFQCEVECRGLPRVRFHRESIWACSSCATIKGSPWHCCSSRPPSPAIRCARFSRPRPSRSFRERARASCCGGGRRDLERAPSAAPSRYPWATTSVRRDPRGDALARVDPTEVREESR